MRVFECELDERLESVGFCTSNELQTEFSWDEKNQDHAVCFDHDHRTGHTLSGCCNTSTINHPNQLGTKFSSLLQKPKKKKKIKQIIFGSLVFFNCSFSCHTIPSERFKPIESEKKYSSNFVEKNFFYLLTTITPVFIEEKNLHTYKNSLTRKIYS